MHRDTVLSKKYLLPLLLTLITINGCASSSNPIHYYLVDPVDYTNVPRTTDEALVIEILDVHIPQYLERFHIAVREDNKRLHFSPSNQWGENLRKNLLRTLARNLAVLLATNDVATPLNRSMSRPDYRLQVHIEQFERDHDGRVKLLARWQLSATDTSASMAMHRAELIHPGIIAGDDYDQIVASMQSLFGQFSDMVASSVIQAESSIVR
jgi:uncharacterized lipoprotein YmbA